MGGEIERMFHIVEAEEIETEEGDETSGGVCPRSFFGQDSIGWPPPSYAVQR